MRCETRREASRSSTAKHVSAGLKADRSAISTAPHLGCLCGIFRRLKFGVQVGLPRPQPIRNGLGRADTARRRRRRIGDNLRQQRLDHAALRGVAQPPTRGQYRQVLCLRLVHFQAVPEVLAGNLIPRRVVMVDLCMHASHDQGNHSTTRQCCTSAWSRQSATSCCIAMALSR